jgi:hypothetical protein
MELPFRPSSTESVSVQKEKEKPWKYIGYKYIQDGPRLILPA